MMVTDVTFWETVVLCNQNDENQTKRQTWPELASVITIKQAYCHRLKFSIVLYMYDVSRFPLEPQDQPTQIHMSTGFCPIMGSSGGDISPRLVVSNPRQPPSQ